MNDATDLVILASAARTTTQTSPDYDSLSCRGIRVIVDMTAAGTGSVTTTIQGKDPVSGQYFTILVGAAQITVSTKVLTVYPGITVSNNVSAADVLTRSFRILATANNANTTSYSISAQLIP